MWSMPIPFKPATIFQNQGEVRQICPILFPYARAVISPWEIHAPLMNGLERVIRDPGILDGFVVKNGI